MTASTSICRGFTHPVVLLMRSSLKQQPMRQAFFTPSTTPLFSTPSAVRSPLSRRFVSTTRQLLNLAKDNVTTAPRAAAKAPAPRGGAASLPTSSYALRLAQNKHGATLFEAAPQRIFLASSYAAGFVCVGGAVVNLYYNVYNPPPGLGAWIPYAFSAVAVMLAFLGMNFALMPAHVVRLIKVLPSAAAAAGTRPNLLSGGGNSSVAHKVQLEVLVRRLTPIPGIPLKRLVVEPNDIIMKTRLFHPKKAEPTEIEKMRMGREWEKRKKEQMQYNRDHLMTAPFRDGAWAMGQFFSAIRRGLTGEGFAPIAIKGGKYKLDIVKGYALEDGRALDRIVRIESDPKYAHLEARSR
ncbi:uncharacterized protein PG998_000419 [Apiospora kogelbergensis]|uniref:uncharacterized protein n=1 Tax=Apiospora kogelbergensis TaxID=1337665 RepID=UPI00312F1B6A